MEAAKHYARSAAVPLGFVVFTAEFINLHLLQYTMKCEVCKKTIEITFLAKLVGGYVKDKDGKKHAVCAKCQNKFQKKEDILKQLTK